MCTNKRWRLVKTVKLHEGGGNNEKERNAMLAWKRGNEMESVGKEGWELKRPKL
jgi:hypothetical protein